MRNVAFVASLMYSPGMQYGCGTQFSARLSGWVKRPRAMSHSEHVRGAVDEGGEMKKFAWHFVCSLQVVLRWLKMSWNVFSSHGTQTARSIFEIVLIL
jgi:hypothetical protein